ncbi:MAG: YciI family protein [Bacteroidota bacterium]
MKNLLCISIFFVFYFTGYSQREFEMKEGDTTYVMKQYFMLIYLSGPERSQDSVTLAQLQKGHLEHIDKMAKAGVVLMAGPFGDNTEKRGILIFDVATQKEAEDWVNQDPMVKAKRLVYEIHPWWCAKGSVLK